MEGKERRSLFLITFFYQLFPLFQPLHTSHHLVFNFPSTSSLKHQCMDFASSRTAWPSPSCLLNKGLVMGHLSPSQSAELVDSNESENLGLLLSLSALLFGVSCFPQNCIMIVRVFFYKDGALGLSLCKVMLSSCFPRNLRHVHESGTPAWRPHGAAQA